MMDDGSVLYLTFDGLLEPLGYSQVARVVVGMASLGFRYRIVSLERERDLANIERVQAMRTMLGNASVDWHPLPYAEGGGAARIARNVGRAAAAVARFGRRARLIHARSYVAAVVARGIRARVGTPYLFDARGYWIDERIEGGRQFRSIGARRVARALERMLYRDAAGMVGLTELHADDVRRGRFGRWNGRAAVAIPTCADYDEFRLREDDPATSDRASELVVGLIGSTNPSYRTRESMRLAAKILAHRPDAVLRIATRQRDEMLRAAALERIAPTRMTIAEVAHADMPRWLPNVDVCLHLLVETPAKRGSVPTKLAELFASGVRPIHIGCNAEVTGWVEAAGTGMVMADCADVTLERAAENIAAVTRDEASLRRGRARTEEHFGLRGGIARYAALLETLGVQRSRS
jgi:hypothetical protein